VHCAKREDLGVGKRRGNSHEEGYYQGGKEFSRVRGSIPRLWGADLFLGYIEKEGGKTKKGRGVNLRKVLDKERTSREGSRPV